MKRKELLKLIIGFSLVAVLAISIPLMSGCTSPTQTPTPEPPESATDDRFIAAEVIDVINGDSILVRIGESTYRVQYVGIDAPDMGEPFAEEAKSKNKELVEGKLVWLEEETIDIEYEGVLLRYVWVDNLLVNMELVRSGLADTNKYSEYWEITSSKYQNALNMHRGLASKQGLGIWQTDTIELQPQ